jgi:hypothetical protein
MGTAETRPHRPIEPLRTLHVVGVTAVGHDDSCVSAIARSNRRATPSGERTSSSPHINSAGTAIPGRQVRLVGPGHGCEDRRDVASTKGRTDGLAYLDARSPLSRLPGWWPSPGGASAGDDEQILVAVLRGTLGRSAVGPRGEIEEVTIESGGALGPLGEARLGRDNRPSVCLNSSR